MKFNEFGSSKRIDGYYIQKGETNEHLYDKHIYGNNNSKINYGDNPNKMKSLLAAMDEDSMLDLERADLYREQEISDRNNWAQNYQPKESETQQEKSERLRAYLMKERENRKEFLASLPKPVADCKQYQWILERNYGSDTWLFKATDKERGSYAQLYMKATNKTKEETIRDVQKMIYSQNIAFSNNNEPSKSQGR